MNTPKLAQDPLFQVEQKIARRADELDRKFGIDPAHALEHWRTAEAEIWSETLQHDDESVAMKG